MTSEAVRGREVRKSANFRLIEVANHVFLSGVANFMLETSSWAQNVGLEETFHLNELANLDFAPEAAQRPSTLCSVMYRNRGT